MLSRWRLWLIPAACMLLVLAACTSSESDPTTTTPNPPTTGPPETTTAPRPVRLVVWVDEIRASSVRTVAAEFAADSGAEVEVQEFPFFDIREAVLTAAPAGEGPDLFIDSNEGTGALMEAGVVAPLNLGEFEDAFLPVALDAFAYRGDVYALPVSVEAVSLFYNRELVPEPPSNFEELRDQCDALGFPTEDGLPCLGLPAGESLHQFPFLGGFGGYLVGFEDRSYDFEDVGIDSPGSLAGAGFLRDLYLDGYALGAVDYSTMADLFNQGAIPFMWTGPWQLAAVEAAGIDFGVAPLPLMDGNNPRPLVGSQGFFVNALSEFSGPARAFLTEYLGTAATVGVLSGAVGRTPARSDALDEPAVGPHQAAFFSSAGNGLPFPNFPELGSVWEPLSEALAAIGRQSGDPAAALTSAAEAVRAAFEAP